MRQKTRQRKPQAAVGHRDAGLLQARKGEGELIRKCARRPKVLLEMKEWPAHASSLFTHPFTCGLICLPPLRGFVEECVFKSAISGVLLFAFDP